MSRLIGFEELGNTDNFATAALERRLTEKLGLRVGIKQAGKGGQVLISYRDLDQLEGVLRLLDPDFA